MIWQKSKFMYPIFCIECKCLQPLNDFDRWDKCAAWIATRPCWRHVIHAFSNIGLYVWVGMDVGELGSSHFAHHTIVHCTCLNELVLLKYYTLVKVIMLLWLVTWCTYKFHNSSWDIRNSFYQIENEICKPTNHIVALFIGCNIDHWEKHSHVTYYVLNLIAIKDGYMIPSMYHTIIVLHFIPLRQALIWKQMNTTDYLGTLISIHIPCCNRLTRHVEHNTKTNMSIHMWDFKIHFLHNSCQIPNRVCQLTYISFFRASFWKSNVKNLQKLYGKYTLLSYVTKQNAALVRSVDCQLFNVMIITDIANVGPRVVAFSRSDVP